MTITEIATATKLIKEIKGKLNELERIIGKASTQKLTYNSKNQNFNSKNHQYPSPRKRNLYQNPDNNPGKV